MNPLMLTVLIQITLFTIGSTLLFFSGKQDQKTRNPYLLIPALIGISAINGLLTMVLVTLASLLVFYMPKNTNKIIGKADLLLYLSLILIMIMAQNILILLFMVLSLLITLLILMIIRKQVKEMPVIYYYSIGYLISILLFFLGIIIINIMIVMEMI